MGGIPIGPSPGTSGGDGTAVAGSVGSTGTAVGLARVATGGTTTAAGCGEGDEGGKDGEGAASAEIAGCWEDTACTGGAARVGLG